MRRRTRKLLLLGGVVIGLGAAGAGGVGALKLVRAASIQRGYARGLESYEAGDYAAAMPLIATYVGRHRADVAALLALAECRVNVPKPGGGEIVEALRYASSAAAIQPDNTEALALLVDLHMRVNMPGDALLACERLLSLDPDNTAALSGRALALLRLGRHEELLDLANDLLEKNPADIDALRLALEARSAAGASPGDIAEMARAAADNAPESLELRVISAQTLASADRIAAAVEQLRMCEGLVPETPRGLADLIGLCELVIAAGPDRSPDAAEEIRGIAQTAAERGMDHSGFERTAAALAAAWAWRQGNTDLATEWIDRARQSGGDSVAIRGVQVSMLFEAGEPLPPPSDGHVEEGPWTGVIDGVRALGRDDVHAARASFDESRIQIARAARASWMFGASLEERIERTEAELAADSLRLFDARVDRDLGEWRLAADAWTALGASKLGWGAPYVLAATTLLDHDRAAEAREAALRALAARRGAREGLIAVEALIACAERGQSQPSDDLRIDALLTSMPDDDRIDAIMRALRARWLLAQGEEAAALDEVGSLGDTRSLPTRIVGSLAASLRQRGYDEWRYLAADGDGSATSLALRVEGMVRADDVEGALSAVVEAREADDSPGLAALESDLLDRLGRRDEAVETLRGLSDSEADSAPAQAAVLSVDAAWSDPALVRAVIERLRDATGEGGLEWRVQEARLALLESPEPASARRPVLLLNEVLARDPRRADALGLLADWLVVLDDRQAAVDALRRAVATGDATPDRWGMLISLLQGLGRREEAVAQLREFARVRDLSDEALRRRARMLVAAGLGQDALRDFDAIRGDLTFADRLLLARALDASDERDKAQMLFDSILDEGPNRSQRRALAVALAQSERWDDALRALALDQKDVEVEDLLIGADVLRRAGRASEAASLLRERLASDTDGRAHALLAGMLLQSEGASAAKAVLDAARDRGLACEELERVSMIIAASAPGASDQDREALVGSLPEGPARAFANAALQYERSPEEVRAYLTRLRDIVAKEPTFEPAWTAVVSLLLDLGENDDAADAAGRAAIALPDSPTAARLQSAASLAAGRTSEAVESASRWEALQPERTAPALARAEALLASRRTAEASALLARIVSTMHEAPGEVDTADLAAAVSLLLRSGDTSAAREASSLGEGSEAWRALLPSIIASSAPDLDAARAWLTSIPAEGSALPVANAWARLGRRFNDVEAFRSSLDTLRPMLASAEPSEPVLVMAAEAAEALGSLDEAERLLRRAIALQPASIAGLNNLAYLLARQPGQAAEGLPLAERAVSLAGPAVGPRTRASLLETLAICRVRSGSPDAALEAAERAMTIIPDSADALLVRAEALCAIGDRRRARSMLDDLRRSAEAGRVPLTAEQQQWMSVIQSDAEQG